MELPLQYDLLDKPNTIRDGLQALRTKSILAIDIEADSLYAYLEKVCLVQISTSSRNTIIDPLLGKDAMPALGTLLADASITKVFHGGDYDIRLLKKDLGFPVRNVVDTMIAAQFTGRPNLGLAALVEEHFHVHLTKKYQRANWAARPLDADRLHYAALDTAYLLELWKRLRSELSGLGRLAWAQEEFSLLEAVIPAPSRAPSCFDIKGATKLKPRQRAVLQALVLLRDEVSRAWDRPPFKVFSNKVLLYWADSPPLSRREVLRTPSASKTHLHRLAPRIVDAVRRARATPVDACPVRSSPGSYTPVTEVQNLRLKRLKQARLKAAARLGLPLGLLVNSKTLEALSRADPGQAVEQLASSLKQWQWQALGPALQHALP